MARIPWFKAKPELYRNLNLEIGQTFPELQFSARNDIVFLSGNFRLTDGQKIIDRFLIEIEFPPTYPKGLPLIYEIGGRIPRIIERHINPSEDACIYHPLELSEVFPEGGSLTDFLNGPVRSFFVSQSYFEKTGTWIFGELPHGKSAIYTIYASVLKTKNIAIINQYLHVISQKEVKGHWPCPCGSGERLRQCHLDQVVKLHQDYHYGVTQWGWRDRTHKPRKNA